MTQHFPITAAHKHANTHEGKTKRAVHHRERAHDHGHKKEDFTYPLMPLKEVKEKSDAGYKFNTASEADYKDKSLSIITIKLPKLGYTPFVMTPPEGSTKLDNGTPVTPPVQVAKTTKSEKPSTGV